MENQNQTNKRLLQDFFKTCQNGIRSGKANSPRSYCDSLGLDYNLLNLGFISGQFHHRRDIEFKRQFERIGILKKSSVPVNQKDRVPYACFGSHGIAFLIKDEKGNLVNLFARRYKLDNPKDVYLYDEVGFYPNVPSRKITTLYLTFGVMDAASLIQSNLLLEHQGVLALFEGRISDAQVRIITSNHRITEIKILTPNAKTKQIQKVKSLLKDKSVTIIEHWDRSINDYVALERIQELESLLQMDGDKDDSDLTDLSNKDLHTSSTLNRNFNKESEDNTENHLSFVPDQKMHQSQNHKVDVISKGNSLEQINSQKLVLNTSNTRYEVVGKLPMDLSQLFVSIRIISNSTGKIFRTKLDLYESRDIDNRISQLPSEFNRSQVKKDLQSLTGLLDQYRDSEINRMEGIATTLTRESNPLNEVTPMAQKNAIAFLQEPGLLSRISHLIETAGIIGEEQSSTTAFVIASSYKMLFPMHGLIMASSGKGKSHLINTIAELIPSEDVINLSRITSRSLYNYQKDQLMYKLLLIQDEDGLDEESLYALRELQTSGFLSSSTSARTAFGKHQSKVTRVNAHFASLMATTKSELYTDNESRSIQIGLDESTEQTRRIIAYSNQQRAGLIDYKQQQNAKHLLRNCIRVLKRERVVNPYAHLIELPIEAKMLRRLNNQFQDFTAQITLLNQYQRDRTESGAILTQKQDIIKAVDLFFSSIMFKVDELDSSTRQLYNGLKEYLKTTPKGKMHEFTRREIREVLKLKKTKTFELFQHLQELEYIHVCKGSSNRGYFYELDQWDEGLNKLKTQIKQQLEEQLQEIPEKQSA